MFHNGALFSRSRILIRKQLFGQYYKPTKSNRVLSNRSYDKRRTHFLFKFELNVSRDRSYDKFQHKPQGISKRNNPNYV